ncbi:DUF2163 domain-containing protein [Abyssibacter profundi]|nr:DUF2163 domain-containing protein [Abyssibacter profundi]
MRSLSAAMQAHIASDTTSLVPCWYVIRADGEIVRGTEATRDVVISSGALQIPGTYQASRNITMSDMRSADDLSVDNTEVAGSLGVDLAVADIEAGLYDNAEIVLFLVNWQAPDDGQIILRRGNIGNIRRTSEGQYSAELRGLTQRLTQTIVRTYGTSCDADLGDTRCGVDLEALTITGTVTAVTSRRRFDATLDAGSPAPAAGYYNGGLLTFTSGDNAGYGKELRRDAAEGAPGELETYEPLPATIEVGDTFTLRPGCDKSAATCRAKFANLVNFRGYGLFVPGAGDMIRGGSRDATGGDFAQPAGEQAQD